MPLFAPHDGRIAYLHMDGNEAVAQAELFVAPAAGGEAANLSHAVDRTLLDLAWSPGGASLVGAADDGERRNLIAFAPTAAPRRIDLGGLDAVTDSMLYAGSSPLRGTIAATGTVAFVGAGPQSPSELYVAEPGRRRRDFRRITRSRRRSRCRARRRSGTTAPTALPRRPC